MMKLKLWKKSEQDRKAFVSLNECLWGVLSDRALHSLLYPVPCTLNIGEPEASELIQTLRNNAWQDITEYLAKAEHSLHQSRQYLERKHYHESITSECLALCLEKGYIDDSRFAEILIRSLIERKKSKRHIQAKLYEQHISPAIYDPLLEDMLDPAETLGNLAEEIEKLLIRYRESPAAKQKEKVFASLYRRGFDLEDISAAWRQIHKS
jgi:SOS response regulatory protein OraA/RecX